MLTDLVGPVGVGDRVVVNTTAVDLGLATGGWHVVHWNLARDGWASPEVGARPERDRLVMKLRYTSVQADVVVTTPGEDDLHRTPVVVCELHSQVACVAEAFAASAPDRALAYVMTDWAALPLALSDLVADLRERGRLAATVTCGQAFGGDHEAVNLTSGLLVAAQRADAVVVGPGPGIVGTRSRFGFSGLDGAGAIDAASRRGGRPILCVRWSDADTRPEHRGLSHHTRTVLAEAHAVPVLAAPRGHGAEAGVEVTEVDVPAGLALGNVETMGRRPEDDPGFFLWSAAAGVLAARLLSE